MANNATPLRRRPLLAALGVIALIFAYRIFAIYTVRSGECTPRPIDPALRRLTRTESGALVSYPERKGFPTQQRPLVVMTYNIEGHDEFYDTHHIAKIAAVINEVKPDIVGLQEVHRKTWQSRFRDQLEELEAATGMHGAFGSSYVQAGGRFGNAVLTRGTIRSVDVHPLPTVGEPRSVMEAIIDIDGATIDVYVTHLSTWGKLNAAIRGEQLECLGRHVATSRWPYLLLGDFNAPPTAKEVASFIGSRAAQLAGRDIGVTHPLMRERIDYIFTDWGWDVGDVRAIHKGSSDHWPVVAELRWNRQ